MTNLTKKARAFVEANAESPVVYGAVTYVPGEAERPENVTGSRYTLEDRRTFALTSDECRTVTPRWAEPR